MRKRSPLEGGFTLAEMLIVIVIISALAGMLIVGIPNIMHKANQVKCASNLRQIGQALQAFAVDHDGYYPALIRKQPPTPIPPQTTPPYASVTLPTLNDGTKTWPYIPWYYELMRSDTGANYGVDEHVFSCPEDQYDPTRDFTSGGSLDLTGKLTYMSDNISYGYNYDVKYSDGTVYRVNSSNSFIGPGGLTKPTPSGADRNPDYCRASEIEDPKNFIVAADSNSEFSKTMNFAISIPIDDSSYRIGSRHWALDRPGANVLFGDNHVETWASKSPPNSTSSSDMAKDINQQVNRRYWTLGTARASP